MEKKIVAIAGRKFTISGNDQYTRNLGECFDPDLIALLALLCEPDFRALDVGANVGLTTLALSEICNRGKVAAIEPVPTTFEFLQTNVSESGASNIDVFNFALGSKPGTVHMEAARNNFSGAFIADIHRIDTSHFSTPVEVKTLDDTFPELSLDRLDFMKVDVEGFELEVFAGAQKVLENYRPMVMFEMNHWCLNIFRRVSLPEFRERVLEIFPCVYAIDGTDYCDFSVPENVHHVFHEHLTRFKFMNLVAGFNRETLLSRLARLSPEVIQFNASDPRLLTQTGVREQGLIQLQKSPEGYALYGPYIRLPAGRYQGSIHFCRRFPVRGSALVDVCVDSGRRVIKQASFKAHGLFGKRLTLNLEFELGTYERDVELRLYCKRGFSGWIEQVEVQRL